MAIVDVSGVNNLVLRGSRWRQRSFALLIASALVGFALFAMPAQANAQGNDSKNWNLPADVARSSQTLQWRTDTGATGSGGVGPGYTFYYQFSLTNNGTDPVTVSGFNSNFVFQMNPASQGDYPLDHCMQFIEEVVDPVRQVYPQTIAPGQRVDFSDNATYHYIYGPPSNECQRASFYFGPPTFRSIETVEPVAPQWRDASCDVGASVSTPDVEGLQYTINGEEVEAGSHAVTTPQSITVGAVALDWFELAEGMDAEWAHDFDAPECTQVPGGGSTVPNNTHTGGAQLAATGSADATSLWAAGAVIAGLGVALLLFGRRRAH